MALKREDCTTAYVEKARAETNDLAEKGVLTVGNAFSPVLLLKGEPGEAEKTGELFSGADGKALRAALLALGYAPEEWLGVATWDVDGHPLDASLLRLAMVTLDPATVVVCDETAAARLRDAFEGAIIQPGYVTQVSGMRVLHLNGFEAALNDPHAKQVMWALLKQVPPLGEPY